MKKLIIIFSLIFLIMTLFGCDNDEVVIEKYETKNTNINDNTNLFEDVVVESINIEDTSIVENVNLEDESLDNIIEKKIEEKKVYRQGENKIVIAFFSAFDKVGDVARAIENYYYNKNQKVDLYEIEAKEPYSEEDLNFDNLNSRCLLEHNNLDVRPELLDYEFNVEKHKYIYIVFPIWLDLPPNIIYTFLESYNFDNKTIVPICVSNDTSFGVKEVFKNYTTANILKELVISTNFVINDIENELDTISFE